MKSHPQKGDLNVLHSPAGIIGVGEVTEVRDIRVEISIAPYRLNGELKNEATGKPIRGRWWLVLHDEICIATKERRNIRGALLELKDDAQSMFNLWKLEHERGTPPPKAKAKVAPPVPTPTHCDNITSTDLKDVANAQVSMWRKTFPKTFAAFERCTDLSASKNALANRKLIDAYREDVAARTGEIRGRNVPADSEIIERLGKALGAFKSKKRDPRLIALDFEIAFGWIADRLCFLTVKERAEAINKKLKTKFTAKQIDERRKRLDLDHKRRTGPAAN